MASTRPWWTSETTRATPEEGGPAGAVFGGDEVDTQDLPVPVGVHPGGDRHGHVHDLGAFSDLLGEGVHPAVGLGTGIEGTVTKSCHRLIRGLGQLGDPVIPIDFTTSSPRRVETL
jgi:hypothetical protein